jgi:hypothetical protein
LVIDPLFPPPEGFSQKKSMVVDICPENFFELVYDEQFDGEILSSINKQYKKEFGTYL